LCGGNGCSIAGGGAPSTISGLAWIGGACGGTRRTSVNREFGQYASITTAAHELGHKYININISKLVISVSKRQKYDMI